MLEDMIGYAANSAIGAAGAGLVLLNRGVWHDDKERGVHIANEKSLSALIIRHFPGYRHISPAIDHFIEGIAAPYGFIGVWGIGHGAFNPQPLQPEYVYFLGFATAVVYKALMPFYCFIRQRRGWDAGDYLQLAADAASLTTAGFLLTNSFHF